MSDNEERPEHETQTTPKDPSEISATLRASKHAAPIETTNDPGEQEDDEEEGGWIGPMPTEAVLVKKRKGNNFIKMCCCLKT